MARLWLMALLSTSVWAAAQGMPQSTPQSSTQAGVAAGQQPGSATAGTSKGTSDSALQQRINTLFSSNPRLTNVRAEIKNGVVTLTGGVQSNQDRQKAFSIANPFVDAHRIANRIVPMDSPALANSTGAAGGGSLGAAPTGSASGPATGIGNKAAASSTTAKPEPH